jgi:hypothetical protein
MNERMDENSSAHRTLQGTLDVPVIKAEYDNLNTLFRGVYALDQSPCTFVRLHQQSQISPLGGWPKIQYYYS